MYKNKIHIAFGILLIIFFRFTALSQQATYQYRLKKELGEMKPIWAWFGYDEPNFTYMKNGKKLLSEIAALSPVPVFVRHIIYLLQVMAHRH
jgi:xylan 1,4-beta-xylosidase